MAANIDPELLAAAEELVCEYNFDWLFDEEDDRHCYVQGDGARNDGGIFGLGLEEELDGVDFGLPNNGHRGVDPATAALPRFQLPDDIELDDPEDQPDAGGADDDPDAL
ncbi:hypothetical protein FRC10_001354, partial [Ceratobasidium sp. 414]